MWTNKASGKDVGRIVSHDNGTVTLEDGSTHPETVFFTDHVEIAPNADAEPTPETTGNDTQPGTGE